MKVEIKPVNIDGVPCLPVSVFAGLADRSAAQIYYDINQEKIPVKLVGKSKLVPVEQLSNYNVTWEE